MMRHPWSEISASRHWVDAQHNQILITKIDPPECRCIRSCYSILLLKNYASADEA